MKQYNQIGKPIKKDEYLSAKANKKFVCPDNREYFFNYRKEGKRYIYIITYKNHNCQIKESEFNKIGISNLLNTIERDIEII